VAARLLLGVLGIAALGVGSAAFAAGSGAVRTASLLLFCFLGIGSAPWQLDRSLGLWARLTLTFVTSVVVMVLVPVAMLAVDLWRPVLAFVMVAGVCLALHGVGLRRALAETGVTAASLLSPRRPTVASRRAGLGGEHPGRLRGSVPVIAGTGICLFAAATHRHLDPDYYGFLLRIGPAWYVGVVLVLLGLVTSRNRERGLALTVYLLVLVLTLTPALTYDGPRSQSAAKHVDFVEQIEAFHRLDTPIGVYNAWNGFFAAMAWVCRVAGVEDPMGLATLWPPLLGFFRVTVLRYLFGQVLVRADHCWVAVALAVLADSISADYFSPQSVGFVLGMAAIGVALSGGPPVRRVVMLTAVGVVLAVTHQFSPYAVGVVLVILVLFGQVRPWWTPALVLVPAVIWAQTHAGALRGTLTFDRILSFTNFQPPRTVAASGLERLPVVRATIVALLVGVVVLAVLAGVTLLRHHRDRRRWALAFSSAGGLLLIAMTPYGQEGIFRATLFGLPWLALLACEVLTPATLARRAALLGTAACLLGAFLVSSFGLDAVNVVRPADLAAVRYFQRHGDPSPGTEQHERPEEHRRTEHYLLLLGPGDHPTTPGMRGGGRHIWGRDGLDAAAEQEPTARQALMTDTRTLTARYVEQAARDAAESWYPRRLPTPPELFALWSPVGADYGRAYGLQSTPQGAAIRDAFLASPYWPVVYERDGTYLFRLDRSLLHADASRMIRG
jgi:hypothetical protein